MSKLLEVAENAGYVQLRIESSFMFHKDLMINLDSVASITLQQYDVGEWIAKFEANYSSSTKVYNDELLVHTEGYIKAFEFAKKYEKVLENVAIEFYKIAYKNGEFLRLWKFVDSETFHYSPLECFKVIAKENG